MELGRRAIGLVRQKVATDGRFRERAGRVWRIAAEISLRGVGRAPQFRAPQGVLPKRLADSSSAKVSSFSSIGGANLTLAFSCPSGTNATTAHASVATRPVPIEWPCLNVSNERSNRLPRAGQGLSRESQNLMAQLWQVNLRRTLKEIHQCIHDYLLALWR